MEFYQVINQRRTVRDFKKQNIPQDVLLRILDAGLKAATHNHLREWEFVVLRDEKEKDNALQFVKGFAQGQSGFVRPEFASGTPMQKMLFEAVPKQYTMLNDSGCVILPFFKAGANLFPVTSMNALSCVVSTWCCIENIFLAATAEELACSIRFLVGDEGAKVAKVVGAPDTYMLSCYIGLGYPADNATALEQVACNTQERIHFGTW